LPLDFMAPPVLAEALVLGVLLDLTLVAVVLDLALVAVLLVVEAELEVEPEEPLLLLAMAAVWNVAKLSAAVGLTAKTIPCWQCPV